MGAVGTEPPVIKSNVGTGPGGSGFGRGFGHQEAPQADGEEEAPQAAEAHSRSAAQQEVVSRDQQLARQLRQNSREVQHSTHRVARRRWVGRRCKL
jgi:hypothetical protein